ncbi:hypothetical protein GQ55_8G215700 [Panicum hallii var. hallii]|uniref:Uncharacterized protein n=1 Tax=Panicum hallii var. hallii TaxID=1504633 RepID=A0A2T7CPU9_9POAL|nr:hypothetical protein GQ55_8G215700 [Panicum hallii var. hallii]
MHGRSTHTHTHTQTAGVAEATRRRREVTRASAAQYRRRPPPPPSLPSPPPVSAALLASPHRRPAWEKRTSATSASQRMESSYAFLNRPFRRLENKILVSIRCSTTFPRPMACPSDRSQRLEPFLVRQSSLERWRRMTTPRP